MVKANPPGTPILTNNSVIFPAVVASAISSKTVKSSNHFSTLAALSVSDPKSVRVAPKENKPLGIDIKPDPIPAKTEAILPTSFSGPSSSVFISLTLVALFKSSKFSSLF